jgi:hypothetical protein
MELDTPVGIDIYGQEIVLILHYQEPVSCTLIYDEHTNKTFRAYLNHYGSWPNNYYWRINNKSKYHSYLLSK